MKLTKWAGAALASAMMMATPHAGAVVVLDQQSLSTYYPDKVALWADVINLPGYILETNQLVSSLSAVQTITAGKKGNLDSILFAVVSPFSGTESLKLSVVDGDYISGSRALIGTINIPFSSLPTSTPAHPAYSFDLSSLHYHVTPGQKYSILLEPTTNVPFNGQALFGAGFMDLIFNTDGTVAGRNLYSTGYSGGMLNYLVDGTPIPYESDVDLIFSSYVDTSAGVPEPATWTLMILGFGGIGAAVRWRGKRAAGVAAA